jgi:hypothetical protein
VTPYNFIDCCWLFDCGDGERKRQGVTHDNTLILLNASLVVTALLEFRPVFLFHVWQFSTVNICFRSWEFIDEKRIISECPYGSALVIRFISKVHTDSFLQFLLSLYPFFPLIYYNPCLMGVLWFLLSTRGAFGVLWALRVMKRSSSSSTGQP